MEVADDFVVIFVFVDLEFEDATLGRAHVDNILREVEGVR